MSQDYARNTAKPIESSKASLPSYYLDISSHVTSTKPTTPFESIQKVYNFVNKKRKHDSSSHKSMQFPPNTKFLGSNVPSEDKKTSTHQEKKTIRSISRPKSGENLQNHKSLFQSRSSNSLSAAKNIPDPVQAPKATAHNKQLLCTIIDRDVPTQSKYPLPKGRHDYSGNLTVHDQEKEERRLRRPAESNKQVNKSMAIAQGVKSYGVTYFHNEGLGPRDEPASVSFPSFRRNNFSHNNSVLHDNSHFQLTIQEDPSSSEFNFESPVPTNRAAQEESKFAQKRFSPVIKRDGDQKDKQSPIRKKPIFCTIENGRVVETVTERIDHEDSSVVITKSSMEGNHSNLYGKVVMRDKKYKATSNMQSLDLQKLCSFYENEAYQGVNHSSFSMNPDTSTKTTNPTHRARMNQSNIVLVGDSIDNQNASLYQNNFGMLETSHFNSNLYATHTVEKDEKPVSKAFDGSKYKDQYKLLTEITAKNEEKTKNFMGPVQISGVIPEKKVIPKPMAKGKVNSAQVSKSSSISHQPGTQNKSPQPQGKKASPKNRPITEPSTENIFQAKYGAAANQGRLEPSVHYSKMERIYESQKDIKRLKLFAMGVKKDNHSVTPDPTSRNTRNKSDSIRTSQTKSQEKPKFLNANKVRDSKLLQKLVATDYSPQNGVDNLNSTGPIVERIKKQTLINADKDKFHAKSQSLGFQELQSNKPLNAILNEQAHITKKTAPSQNKSQDYYADFPVQIKDNAKKNPQKHETRYHWQQANIEDILSQIPHHNFEGFDGAETFSRGNLKLGEASTWETPTINGEVPVPAGDAHVDQKKSLLEQPCFQNESLSEALNEPSFRGVKGLNQILQSAGTREYNSIREQRKEQQSTYRTNTGSRDNTFRNSIEKQMSGSVFDVRIDEQEESMYNKGERSESLNVIEVQVSRDDTERKVSAGARSYKEQWKFKEAMDLLNAFKFLTNWEGHRNTVTSIVKNVSKNVVWSASKDNTIRAWMAKDLTGGSQSRSSSIERETSKMVLREKRPIECLMCNEQDDLIFSGGSDHEIKIWNSTTWQSGRKLKGHKGGVFGLANLGRTALLSCSGDQTIKLYKKWDVNTGSCVQTWAEHNNRVTSVLYDRAKFAHSFLSCSAEGTIKVWDIRIPQSVATFSDHELDVTSLVYVSTQRHFASGSLDKTIKIWDLNMRTMVHTIEIESPVHALGYFAKENKIIVGTDQLKTINIEDDFSIEAIEGKNSHEGSIRSLLIDNESDTLYTGSVDSLIKVWLLKKSK